MTIEKIVDDAIAQGIYLYLDDDRLAFKAKKGSMSSELKAQLQTNKTEIIQYLLSMADKKNDVEADLISGIMPIQGQAEQLSFAQQRLWFIDQYEGGSSRYNVQLVFELQGHVNVKALQSAFSSVIDRHAILRTCYREVDDKVKPHVLIDFDFELSKFNLLEPEASLNLKSDILNNDLNYSFLLESDLPIRAGLICHSIHHHTLFITVHHIAFDGWSRFILYREISHFYHQNISGGKDKLPELMVQYSDFAAWQINWLNDERVGQSLKYWEAELESIPLVHKLPLDNLRPEVPQFKGVLFQQYFPQHLIVNINGFCRENAVTFFEFMQTAFALLVSKYSNQSDIVMGSPLNNRQHPEVNDVIGFFLNSIVIRTVVNTKNSFLDLLHANKKKIREGGKYPVPFEKLVEHLNPKRQISHDPIFQIVFGVNSLQEEVKLSLTGMETTELHHSDILTVCDLEIKVLQRPEELIIHWEYNTTLFDEKSISQMAFHYQKLVENIISHPTIALGNIEIEDVNRYVRNAVNLQSSQSLLHSHKGIYSVFKEQCKKTPESIAVRYNNVVLTYAELMQITDRLSNFLTQENLPINSCVGVFCERSVNTLIAILGINGARLTFVPIDKDYPADRIKFITSDADIALVLTTSSLINMISENSRADVVLIDEAATDQCWMAEYDGDEYSRAKSQEPDDKAYIIYTSGTTGNPKGVVISNANILSYLNHACKSYYSGATKGAVVSSTVAFDATYTTLLSPLALGKEVIILDEADIFSQLQPLLFSSDAPLVFKLTPSHLRLLDKHLPPDAKSDIGHHIVIGGEQLTVGVLKNWCTQYLQNSVFINEYGPTEATVGCSVESVSKNSDVLTKPCSQAIPIGLPIDGVDFVVLNDMGQVQPVNTIGELYISGVNLSSGYQNLDELSEQCFKYLPISESVHARFYKTGDLVRKTHQAKYEFIGRKDSQVKFNGYRIETNEISLVFNELPEVQLAVPQIQKRDDTSDILKVFLLLNADLHKSLDEGTLYVEQLVTKCRTLAQQKLPLYLQPSEYDLLKYLPLTSNGKFDHDALASVAVGLGQKNKQELPKTNVQKHIAGVWVQVLGLEQVYLDDNFFSAGGDSISSIKLVSELRKVDIGLEVRDIFKHQTVRKLAEHVNPPVEQEKAHVLPFSLIDPQETARLQNDFEDVYPLSYLQSGMIFHSSLEANSSVYHDITSHTIKTHWNEEKFRFALSHCIKRYPVLRSHILVTAGLMLQCVNAEITPPLTVFDIRILNESEQRKRVAHGFEEEKNNSFELDIAPLFRIFIYLLNEDRFHFVLSFHHAILDGWSRSVFVTELFKNYSDLLLNRNLVENTIDWHFREFIAMEKASVKSERAKSFFESMLAKAPQKQLPSSLLGSTTKQKRRVLKSERFANMSPQILSFASDLGIPIQAVLLAVHLRVLSFLSGNSSAVTCMTNNGRPETIGGESAVGLFLNSLPICVDISRSESWRQLINHVTDVWVESLTWRHFPLSEIQKCTDKSFSEVTLSYTHFHIHEQVLDNKDYDLEVEDTNSFELTNYDFHLEFTRYPNSNNVEFVLTYEGYLFDEAFIARVENYYCSAFQYVLQDCDKAIFQCNLLSEQELLQLNKLAQAEKINRRDVLIHEKIAHWSAVTPNNTAMVSDEGDLSYQLLHDESNRLAVCLNRLGVKSGDVVGLYIEYGQEALIGILGVLKAGAAYLPLDPAYPEERIQFMVSEAGAKIILTDMEHMSEITVSKARMVPLDESFRENLLDSIDSDDYIVGHSGISPQSIAYVLFTSGSTGRPKGVKITHSALSNYVQHAYEKYWHDNLNGGVVSSSLSFDATVTSLWTPLYAGSQQIVLATDSSAIEQLKSLLFDNVNSYLFKLTPAHLEGIFQFSLKNEMNNDNKHVVVIGGEQLRVDQVTPLTQCFSKTTVINEYGPTETTVGSCYYKFGGNELNDIESSVVPIGRGITNSIHYVLDGNGQQCPIDVAGELFIGGDGLAAGYLNQLESNEKFISRNNTRLYRTGDLVKILNGGEMEFVGRMDEQISIKGRRIEIAEIETCLNSLPSIEQSAVVLTAPKNSHPHIVAYVIIAEKLCEGSDNVEQNVRRELNFELKSALRAKLPEYMIPSLIIPIEAIPLNENGKLSRSQLPEPDETDWQLQAYVAPETPLEKRLCQIWERTLSVSRVGTEDNFFELGGDSLMLVRLNSAIAQEFNVKLPLAALYESPTIAGLSNTISECSSNKALPAIEKMKERNLSDNMELGDI